MIGEKYANCDNNGKNGVNQWELKIISCETHNRKFHNIWKMHNI